MRAFAATAARCVTFRAPCVRSVAIWHIVCEANCAEVLSRWGYAASKPRGLLASEVLWTRPKGVLEMCHNRTHIEHGGDEQ